MATGVTSNTSFTNVFRKYLLSSIMTREHSGVMTKLTDKIYLPNGQGLTAYEAYYPALAAQELTDGVEFDSPTSWADAGVFTLSPGEIGVQVLYTKKGVGAISDNYATLLGKAMQAAVEYKIDRDGLVKIGQFGATYGSSSTFTYGLAAAALVNIRTGMPAGSGVARTGARDTGDPPDGPFNIVIHARSQYDLRAQMSGLFHTFSGGVSATIGTTAASTSFAPGSTGLNIGDYQREWIVKHEIPGDINGARAYIDNNFAISSNVYNAGIFARDAVVHLRYRQPNTKMFETEDGRAYKVTQSEHYSWGIRVDTWGGTLNLDATAPTA